MKPEAVSNNSARILSNWSRPRVGWLDSVKPKGSQALISRVHKLLYTFSSWTPKGTHKRDWWESWERDLHSTGLREENSRQYRRSTKPCLTPLGNKRFHSLRRPRNIVAPGALGEPLHLRKGQDYIVGLGLQLVVG